jgi:hypothetical protein
MQKVAPYFYVGRIGARKSRMGVKKVAHDSVIEDREVICGMKRKGSEQRVRQWV